MNSAAADAFFGIFGMRRVKVKANTCYCQGCKDRQEKIDLLKKEIGYTSYNAAISQKESVCLLVELDNLKELCQRLADQACSHMDCHLPRRCNNLSKGCAVKKWRSENDKYERPL